MTYFFNENIGIIEISNLMCGLSGENPVFSEKWMAKYSDWEIFPGPPKTGLNWPKKDLKFASPLECPLPCPSDLFMSLFLCRNRKNKIISIRILLKNSLSPQELHISRFIKSVKNRYFILKTNYQRAGYKLPYASDISKQKRSLRPRKKALFFTINAN